MMKGSEGMVNEMTKGLVMRDNEEVQEEGLDDER